MANTVSDETVEYVGILAELELLKEEKESARENMGQTLGYFDKLNELDTVGTKPMSHAFPVYNVFRENVVTDGDKRGDMLRDALESREGMFKVPRAIE